MNITEQKINPPGPAPSLPPPSPPVITSLTSKSTTQMAAGTTSLAEALATSMADYVCENRRKNNNVATTTAALSKPTATTITAPTSANSIAPSPHATQPQIIDESPKPTAQPSAANHAGPGRKMNNSVPASPPRSTQNGHPIHPRVVSGEHPKPIQPPPQASQPPHLKLTPRTVTNTNSTNKLSSSTSSTGKNSAASSMSSAVADLASGMFNFQPSKTNIGGSSSTTSSGHSSGHSSNGHGNLPRANSHGSGSAPIISGTAAAVLALQNTFYTAPAIVSNTVESGGTASDPPSHPMQGRSTQGKSHGVPHGASHAGAVGGGRSSPPQGSPTSTNSPSTPTSRDTANSKSSFPTRYSDGAPIIAGTAAAQMEAIATATAARITSITNDGGANAHGVGMNLDVNAVASLGPVGDASCGAGRANGSVMGEPSSRSHGFTPGAHYHNGSFKGGDLVSTGASMSGGARMAGSGSHKSLSWVDYGGGGSGDAGATRVAPEDASRSRPAYQASTVPASAPRCSAAAMPETRPGGGMDILAEITCHAPPMSVPVNVSQVSTVTTSSASTAASITPSSYHQHPSSSVAIPSYQEIYQQQQQRHHHHQQQQQAQHTTAAVSMPSTPFASPALSSATASKKRVSAIPSYQEIYREMGLSSPRPKSSHIEKHANANGNNAHYSTSNYSIEEVQLDHNHRYPAHLSSPHGTRSSTAGPNHQRRMHSNNPQRRTGANHAGGGGLESDTAAGGARTMSHHYTHRTPTTHFGHVHRDDIEEGKELYTRKDLMHLGGHLGETKDVHGNMKEGCDSLVIGNLEREIREGDGLVWFLYSTDRSNGGGALCRSYHKKTPVRVFRSSLLGGRYAPPFLDVEDDEAEDSDVAYRYDGLYMVRAVWDAGGSETENFPIVGVDGWQTYFFTRVPKKPLNKDNMEAGLAYNMMGAQELWSLIQKMRGVRRPKKFEIPQPPVKLTALKKSAVSGVYKDRKCPGWAKPVPVVAAPVAPKPPPQAPTPKAKCQRTSSTGEKKLQKEEKVESESSSSEEDEEETKVPPAAATAMAGEDDSDSDTSHQHRLRQHTILSARAPSKALTPRPRLNSMAQPKEVLAPAPNHEDDDSSDDSDASTSTSQIAAAAAAARQKKRKTPSQSHANKIQTSIAPPAPALSDACSFFPKRASAARAEAANRHMFGKKTYKRKSSESSTTPAKVAVKQSPRAAAVAAVAGSVAAGVRKRTKVIPQRLRDDASASSSSSSEEEPDPDVIDQSILTIGSRVLVIYKGSVFKATIRKRRFKNDRHDFLIHYDGNKKTNVHWVPLDRITEILEIKVVDARPKRKRQEQRVKQPVNESGGAAKKKGGVGKKRDRKKKFLGEHGNHDSEDEEKGKVSTNGVTHDEPGGNRAVPLKEDNPSDDVEKAHSRDYAEKLHTKDAPSQTTAVKQSSENEASPPEEEKEENPNNGEQVKDEIPPSVTEMTEKENSHPITTATTPDEGNDGQLTSTEADTNGNDPEIKNEKTPSKANSDAIANGDNDDDSTYQKKTTPDIKEEDFTVTEKCQKPNNDIGPEHDKMETEEHEAAVSLNDLAPINSEQPENGEENKKPTSISKNIKTTTSSSFITQKPREAFTCDTDVQKLLPLDTQESVTTDAPSIVESVTAATKDPLQILAEEAESDILDDLGGSDENNSTIGSVNAPAERLQQASASGESTSELKYPVGAHVYVEYRQIFYSSSIVKTRRKRKVMEYLVHYEGYKKSSNRWVKENALHEVNVTTTQRFEEQRLIPADILYESPAPVFRMTTRRKKATEMGREMGRELQLSNDMSPAVHPLITDSTTAPKKPPPRRLKSDASDITTSSLSALESLEAGVAFLPGSMVFVEWSGALYLAKMLRKRYSGNRTEYLISYEGFDSVHDAWASILKIYEVNPQTKRVFKLLNSEILPGTTYHSDKAPPKRRPPPPQGSRRSQTRKKTRDDKNAAIEASNGHVAPTTKTTMATTRNSSLDSSTSSRGASSSSASRATQPALPQTSEIDMEGIEPGVEFLPGSTLFAEYKGELCLAKMLKKRGKGDYMEYLLQYNSNVLKTKKQKAELDAEDSRFWVSTSLVYEINPQTKRMFRKLSNKTINK